MTNFTSYGRWKLAVKAANLFILNFDDDTTPNNLDVVIYAEGAFEERYGHFTFTETGPKGVLFNDSKEYATWLLAHPLNTGYFNEEEEA